MINTTNELPDQILIIDDDKNGRWLMRRMLEMEGYVVEEAGLGSEGLEKYAQHRPNLVLVDAMMPGLNGFDVCEYLQRLPIEEQVPVIMITALNDQTSIDRAFAAGATDYITKPVHWPVLRHRIRRMLATEHAERKLAEQHNLLRTLIDNIPDAIYAKDRDQRYILSNVAHTKQIVAKTQTDHEVDIGLDVVGQSVNVIPLLSLATEFEAADQQVLQSGQSFLNNENMYVDAFGNQCWNLTTRVALRDSDGKINGVVGISRDITVRKRTEALILQSEERFRLLVKNSSELITVLAETGTVTYQSESIERVLGFQPSAWLGQSIQQFVHPDDWDGLSRVLADIRAGRGQIFKVNCRIANKTGDWRIMEGTGYWLDNPSVSGVVTNVHDMTEYRQIETSLVNSEAAEHEQRLLAEALRDTAATLANTLDPELVLRHILFSIDHVVPHDAADIMLIENNEAHIVANHGYSKTFEATIKNIRFPLDTPNLHKVIDSHLPLIISDTMREPGWVSFPETAGLRSYLCAPIDVHGHIIGFVNVSSQEPDFYNFGHGQRLQAFADQVGMALENSRLYDQLRIYTGELERLIDIRTAELNRVKEHVEAILDSTSDAILVVQADGNVQRTNRSFDQLFGYQPSEILTHQLTTLVLPDFVEPVNGAFDGAWQMSTAQRIEVDARRKDGSTFNADITLSPIQHSEMKATTDVVEVVCSIRDMTEYKKIETELYNLNQLKNEFLSTAAHELRTPLASILGFSELLITRTLDADRSKRYMTIINEQSIQLSKIVDALLDISRIESKQGLDLDLSPIDVSKMITHVLTYFAEYLPQYQFQTTGLSDCPPAFGDLERLSQVLQNLVSNAIKYSPNGGEIAIRAEIQDNMLEISVQDWGIGMTEEQQTHLFERFYRADASNTTISGTGLGLAISKLIIELHGGRIWVKSAHQQGTTMFFTLPIATDQTHVPAVKAAG